MKISDLDEINAALEEIALAANAANAQSLAAIGLCTMLCNLLTRTGAVKPKLMLSMIETVKNAMIEGKGKKDRELGAAAAQALDMVSGSVKMGAILDGRSAA